LIYHAKTPEEKAKAIEDILQYADQWQKNISKQLGDKKLFFPETGVTGVDLSVFDALKNILNMKSDFKLEANLKALWEHLATGNANLTKWLAEDQTKKQNTDIKKLFHMHDESAGHDHEDGCCDEEHEHEHEHEHEEHSGHHHPHQKQQHAGHHGHGHDHSQHEKQQQHQHQGSSSSGGGLGCDEKEALKLKIQLAELEMQTLMLKLRQKQSEL
jgi:hypothetical protein